MKDGRKNEEASTTRPTVRRKGAETTRRKGSEHFDKAFGASAKLLDAEERLKAEESGDELALSSATQNDLTRTARKESARLKSLAARDGELTRLLAEYSRQHGREIPRRKNRMRLRSYAHFIKWGIDWCDKQRDEILMAKLTDLDPRTVQDRLQSQFQARGKPGRKREWRRPANAANRQNPKNAPLGH